MSKPKFPDEAVLAMPALATAATEGVLAAKASEPKGVGRPKGSRNRSTVLIKEAITAVYADLQESAGGDHAHFRGWAEAHPTEFYRMCLRLLPLQVDAQADVRVVGTVLFKGVND